MSYVPDGTWEKYDAMVLRQVMTENSTGNKSNSAAMIDQNLRSVYKDVVEEEVPDRFKELLAQLREAGSKENSDK